MLESLAEAIETLDIPIDGAALVGVLALRDQLDARITEAVGTFDAHGLWDIDAATSMTAWLVSSASMTRRAATRLASLARRLQKLPVCAAAYGDGTLSGGQIEAILANVDDSTVDLFAESEAELVPYLAPLTIAGCGRAMAAWKERARVDQAEPAEPERSLHLSQTLDDRYVVDGSFDAEGGAVVATALRLATTDDTDTARTPATRRADALVEVCRYFLDHQISTPGGRHRPHLNVVIDLDALQEGRGGRVLGGPSLDGATVSRLVCDSSLHRVLMAGRRRSWITGPPPGSSPRTCGLRWSSGTSTAGSRAVTVRPTGRRVTCATRRYQPCGMKGPACGLSQQLAETGSSPTLEARGRMGAAPTTSGRCGTARRAGLG